MTEPDETSLFPNRAILLKVDDAQAVAAAIGEMTSAEGYTVLPVDSATPDSTALLLRAGLNGWLQIEAEDAGFFLHSAQAQPIPRFVHLCAALQCEGLSVTAYSEAEITTLHVDQNGNWIAAGFVDTEFFPDVPLYEQPLSEAPSLPDLSALNLDLMETHGPSDAVSVVLREALGHDPAAAGNDVRLVLIAPRHARA